MRSFFIQVTLKLSIFPFFRGVLLCYRRRGNEETSVIIAVATLVRKKIEKIKAYQMHLRLLFRIPLRVSFDCKC
jgi:hypothetical protein